MSGNCFFSCFGKTLDRDKDGDIDLEDFKILGNDLFEQAKNTIENHNEMLKNIEDLVQRLSNCLKIFKAIAKNDPEITKQIDMAFTFLDVFGVVIDSGKSISSYSLPKNSEELETQIKQTNLTYSKLKEYVKILVDGKILNLDAAQLKQFDKFEKFLTDTELKLVQYKAAKDLLELSSKPALTAS